MSFLDSSGLAVLLAAAALARVHGADLHLAASQRRVARLLEITGAWRAVRMYDHVEQALAAVEAISEHSGWTAQRGAGGGLDEESAPT